MTRVPIRPELLRWARERAGVVDSSDFLVRFPKLREWEAGEMQPTLRQAEDFARAVHVPFGYLLLPAPPPEPLPIPDFRTLDGRGVRRASPDLLDTLYSCQERQGWYRDFALAVRLPEAGFVSSASLEERPEDVARRMTVALNFDLGARAACPTWEEALRQFIIQADRIGVLVMVSGIVGSNTHRPLDPEEFRGFALADRRAPLVFVNGADTKAAQMFTLAHELAHLWLGTSAVSDVGAAPLHGHRREEIWCNAVAAELLVPVDALRLAIDIGEPHEAMLARLTRRFKVSSLVILRRLLDVGALDRLSFDEVFERERARLRALARARRTDGGDFYRTTLARVGRRFARALVENTVEGQTLYRDAFRMLGITKTSTFNNLGREAGVLP